MKTVPLYFHPDSSNGNGSGGKADPRGPGAGAGAAGGVTGVSGAGKDDQRTGGTSGIETEKATGGDGVASGGKLAGPMNDAGVRATGDPDRQQEVRQDLMPELGKGETPNPT
jgi:hypothetical protein